MKSDNRFHKYFVKKFKSYLRRTGLIKYGARITIIGPNREVLERLIGVLGRKLGARIVKNGKRIGSYSLEHYCVRGLVGFMNGEKIVNSSPLSVFSQDEINRFALLEGLGVNSLVFNKEELLFYEMMLGLQENRPGIFHATRKLLEKISQ